MNHGIVAANIASMNRLLYPLSSVSRTIFATVTAGDSIDDGPRVKIVYGL